MPVFSAAQIFSSFTSRYYQSLRVSAWVETGLPFLIWEISAQPWMMCFLFNQWLCSVLIHILYHFTHPNIISRFASCIFKITLGSYGHPHHIHLVWAMIWHLLLRYLYTFHLYNWTLESKGKYYGLYCSLKIIWGVCMHYVLFC